MNDLKCTMKTKRNSGSGWLPAALAVLLAGSATLAGTPVGSGWTYQGKLNVAGSPLNGAADFEFTLWNADVNGNMIGEVVEANDVDVVDGLFTVELDFGAEAFNGKARWLEIDVRSPAGDGEFTTLDPRQPLTAAPYALALPGLRTEQHSTSPNVIGGHTLNSVAANAHAGTIAGGGIAAFPNLITDDFGSIGGGYRNTSGDSAVVAGGWRNTASGRLSAIPGGSFNTAAGQASFAAGNRANANHDGTFVWADGLNSSFNSTADNQFLIRAAGGVGIGETNPSAMLDVLGTTELNGDVTINSDLTVDTDTLFVNGANGRVGIGTSSPSARLEVAGTPGVDGIMFPDGTLQTSAAIGANTEYLKLGPGAFAAVFSNDHIVNHAVDGVWTTGSNMIAPVQLPAGARILSVTAYVRDEVDQDLRFLFLAKTNVGSGFSPTGVDFDTSGNSGYFSVTFDGGPTINDSQAYFFLVIMNGGSPGNNRLTVNNILVEWTMAAE